eukprot:SAG25_NODE_2689_length_1448_cov_1.176427_2_plen_41_part_01
MAGCWLLAVAVAACAPAAAAPAQRSRGWPRHQQGRSATVSA